MGLLRSVDNVPGIDFHEYRESEYYNKYKYKLSFKLFGMRYMYRIADEKSFDAKIKINAGYWAVPARDVPAIVNNKYALLKIVFWASENTGRKKSATLRSESDNVSVFSNDLLDLQTLAKELLMIKPDLSVYYTEAKTSTYVGVKYFVKEPKHKYRVYLRSKRVEKTQVAELREFLRKTKSLHPSNSTKKWVRQDKNSWMYNYCSSAYSIDYDDESTLSYLMLVHGDLIGKRFKLEKHPEL